jgi:hypothetical protein
VRPQPSHLNCSFFVCIAPIISNRVFGFEQVGSNCSDLRDSSGPKILLAALFEDRAFVLPQKQAVSCSLMILIGWPSVVWRVIVFIIWAVCSV